MKLLYLSEENLRDSFFIKDLVHNFGKEGPWWIIHEGFGSSISDTKFVTKRLSAMLSEAVVYNHAFSGEQRQILFFSGEKPGLKKEYLLERMKEVQAIILNPVFFTGQGPVLSSGIKTANLLRENFPIQETYVFTRNPLSPLATKKERISSNEDFQKLLTLYEEEKLALENALKLSPSIFATPVNFAK